VRAARPLAGVLVVLAVIGVVTPAFAQTPAPLNPRRLLGGLVEMLVPADFTPMSDENLRRKYPAERRPTLVLANEPASVSVAFNHTRDALPAAALPQAHRAFERMFRTLYPTAQWFRSEITTLNGRDIILLELRTPAIDTDVRNLMLATSLDERLLLISVNMTRELEADWLDTANRMIQSIVIRP
jgi:hypothetical protein